MIIAQKVGSGCEKQLREACAHLDRSLRQGVPATVERYFSACPLLAAGVQSAVDLIYVEFATREELGQRPTPDEYYLRFPHWKAALERQFAVHEWLRQGSGEEDLFAAESEPAPPIPSWLGQYELLEEIACGGVGRVFKAFQHGLDRTVAVKVLRPEFGSSLAAREQFCREARVMARLRHPNIMPVHDVGECDGIVYFSMAYMAGGSLADQPADCLTAALVVDWMEVLARAVHHAHRHGIVHCDLKPSNVLLDDAGYPVLSDFGLAQAPARGDGPIVLRLFAGSPAYMAPEQLPTSTGVPAPALDIWALGVMFYELLAGRRPFVSDQLAGLTELISTKEPASLCSLAPDVPERLEVICDRCLAKCPEDRYSSAAELADDLRDSRA